MYSIKIYREECAKREQHWAVEQVDGLLKKALEDQIVLDERSPDACHFLQNALEEERQTMKNCLEGSVTYGASWSKLHLIENLIMTVTGGYDNL